MYVVRQVMLPLRVPMRVSETGELLHAVPRSSYTVFASVDEATAAIGQTIVMKGRDDAEFEVVTQAQHDQEAERLYRMRGKAS